MKRIWLLLITAIIFFIKTASIYAQEVIYSAYDKFDYRNGEYAVVGMTGGLLYTYRSSQEGAILEAFDDSMNKAATIILDFFPKKIYATRFIAYPDRIVVLYQALESNKVVQYVALLDDHARLMGRPIELGTVKPGIFGPVKSYFFSAVSEDKKNILVYTLNEKGNTVEFDARWIDDSAKLVKRSKASFKTENAVTSGDVNIDNNGNVFMAAYTTVGYRDFADDFWIAALPKGDNKFTLYNMPLNGKYATGGYLKIDNLNGKVYFGGYYSDRKNGGTDGVIFSAFNMTNAAFDHIKLIPFDEQLHQLTGAERKNHAFDNFMVKQLIVKNDGGFVMISESILITTRTTYAPGLGYYSSFYSPFGPYNNTMIREYHYDDILAISYNKEGVKEWSSIIPKEQYSQEDGAMFSSYVLLNSGGSLAFLFNDYNSSLSRIQLATMNADGNTQINSFTAKGNNNPDWLPRSGKQVAARVIIVPCLFRKQICYAKVVF